MPHSSARPARARDSTVPAYAELHCRSSFSFLNGASQPAELVARAKALRYTALAITDECSVAGVVRAHEAAQNAQQGGGLPLVCGAEMALDGGARLVLLVQSRRGWGNLVQWITVARRRAPKGSYRAEPGDLEGRVPTAPQLAGLPGCFALLLPLRERASTAERERTSIVGPEGRRDALPGGGVPVPANELLAQALWLKTWFGSERAAIALPRLLGAHDAEVVEAVQQTSELSGLRIAAVGSVVMHRRSRKALHDALTATRLNCTVAEAGLALHPNAEAHLRALPRLAALFRPEWCAAAVEIAASCAFSLAELRYEYPREIVPEGHSPTSWLRVLVEEGLVRRYGPAPAVPSTVPPTLAAAPVRIPSSVRAAVEHELALIAELRYEPYFLTVADLVQWARAQGILCQGRGSAANSAVCYALGVTEVDPARMTLLFERFVSRERNEPPDIDIDFEHQRREEVIQYVYRKYGRHRAALTAVVISYRGRSALRDIGRALGFDDERIAAAAKAIQWWSGKPDTTTLQEQGFDPASPLVQLWIELARTLIGFPRHLSQHPGGFVIARDDLAQLVPVENAAMADRSVIQWDKDDLDVLGLIKVDLLALGMLSAIRRALGFVAHKLGRSEFRMQDVPAEDPAVYAMLSRGDSVGTFQVESRAQMSMLPRLKPANFYDLVIEVAIVRPGPIQGGMVHPYLRRRSGQEPVQFPSREVEQALARTLGVPIFQEQVMQLAILAADFTPGEADALRRAMAAWKRRGGLGPFHERLVGRMVEKGYTREYAEAIFRQIEGFGEYGFPESHAASFALLVYVSAWLKCHHPDAFLAALLNSQPMGFYAPAQLVRDARAHGVEVRPVDVLRSEWDTVLEPPPANPGLWPVRLGLSRVIGLREDTAGRIVASRRAAKVGEGGRARPWDGVEDLARCAALDAYALGLLARADALAGLAGHRHAAAWAVAGVDTRAKALLATTRTEETALEPAELPAPGTAATVIADYRATGLSLTAHPLALLRPLLAPFKVQPAAVLAHYPHGRLARASGLVTHRQRPETAKGVVFVTLEDDTGAVNVIVWPAVAEVQRKPLLAAQLLTVYGIWQREGEVRHLVARTLVDHTALLRTLAQDGPARDFRSRDFH